MQNDDKQEKKGQKKLTLTVRNVETMETRASPHTACPGWAEAAGGYGCCEGSIMQAAKLTAVAYF